MITNSPIAPDGDRIDLPGSSILRARGADRPGLARCRHGHRLQTRAENQPPQPLAHRNGTPVRGEGPPRPGHHHRGRPPVPGSLTNTARRPPADRDDHVGVQIHMLSQVRPDTHSDASQLWEEQPSLPPAVTPSLTPAGPCSLPAAACVGVHWPPENAATRGRTQKLSDLSAAQPRQRHRSAKTHSAAVPRPSWMARRPGRASRSAVGVEARTPACTCVGCLLLGHAMASQIVAFCCLLWMPEFAGLAVWCGRGYRAGR